MTHIPTSESRAEVSAMLAFGITQDEAARYLGISDDTLRKHYPQEVAQARTKRVVKVASFLYSVASGAALQTDKKPDGAPYQVCVDAAKYYLKSQGGPEWQDKANLKHTSPDGSMTPRASLDVSKLSNEAMAEILRAFDETRSSDD